MPASSIRRQSRTRTRTRMTILATCFLAFFLVSIAPVTAGALGQDLQARQLASSADADGNTVVYSVDPDGTTSTIETVAAADTAAAVPAAGATTTAAPDPNFQDTQSTSVNLGQQASSPTSSTSRAPPTTYIVYITINGVQTSSWATFTASTPSTPPAVIPSSGSIVPYSDYIPAPSSTAARGSSVGKKVNRQQGQIAAMGVLLAIIGGAIAVW